MLSSRCEIAGGGETDKEQRLFLGGLGIAVRGAQVPETRKVLCSSRESKGFYEKEGRGNYMLQIKKIRGKETNLVLTGGATSDNYCFVVAVKLNCL